MTTNQKIAQKFRELAELFESLDGSGSPPAQEEFVLDCPIYPSVYWTPDKSGAVSQPLILDWTLHI